MFSVSIWATMVQLLPQIIINRIGLILDNPKRLRIYKYGTATLMTMVCISVFCIWIPARMGVSDRFVAINDVWDRCEKVIFLFVDLFLNGTFLYLVKSRLISYGLTKYTRLFWFTVGIALISISMDVGVNLCGALSSYFDADADPVTPHWCHESSESGLVRNQA
jgi:hypothetical protein